MNQLITLTLCLSLACFITAAHPLYLSGALLGVSLSLIGGMAFFFSHWVNYVLGIVYVGGVLILVLYISAIIPFVKSGFYWWPALLLFPLIGTPQLLAESHLTNENNFLLFVSSKSSSLIILFLLLFLLVLYAVSLLLKKTSSPLRALSNNWWGFGTFTVQFEYYAPTILIGIFRKLGFVALKATWEFRCEKESPEEDYSPPHQVVEPEEEGMLTLPPSSQ